MAQLYAKKSSDGKPKALECTDDGLLKVDTELMVSGTDPLPTQIRYFRTAPIVHRSAITVADKLLAPSLSSEDVATGGSLNANTTYYLAVSPESVYGAKVPTVINIATANDSRNTHMIDLVIAQVANAVSYELFCSIDSAPKWVGKVTEAQRAAGCKISSVGGIQSPSAGVAAGTVRIGISHAALGSNASSQTNAQQFGYDQSYIVPTPDAKIECAGCQYVAMHIRFEWDDLRSCPSLVLVLFAKDEDGLWGSMGVLKMPDYTALYGQIGYQEWEVPVHGAVEMCALVDYITGQNARVTIKASRA